MWGFFTAIAELVTVLLTREQKQTAQPSQEGIDRAEAEAKAEEEAKFGPGRG